MRDFLKKLENIVSFFYARKIPVKTTYSYFYQLKWQAVSFLTGFKPILYLLNLFPSLRTYFFTLESSERIVEIPFVLNNIPLKEARNLKILEVGCAEGLLSMQLASFGAKVTGIDLRMYPLTHSNFHFEQGDFLRKEIKESCFDFVILVSVIEHIGLEVYGEKQLTINKDMLAIEKAKKILKLGGKLIITFPYGQGGIGKWRVYEQERVETLLKGLSIRKERYFLRKNKRDWIEVSKEELKNVESLVRVNGVGLFLLEKEGKT